jgi:hypothetical protein
MPSKEIRERIERSYTVAPDWAEKNPNETASLEALKKFALFVADAKPPTAKRQNT